MIAGIDGCPGGRWVIATATIHHPTISELELEVVDNLASTIERLRQGDLTAVAIDMPIGLPDSEPRRSDREARLLLGPRRSSVFPTPVRATLSAESYEDACERSRRASGKALSKQAFNILDRIAMLDELVEPADQDRWVEAHPELAFTRLRGDHVPHNKHGAAGRALRIDLLGQELPASEVAKLVDRKEVPTIDTIDALALVTTAARVAAGNEIRLGTQVDSTGKTAEVVY